MAEISPWQNSSKLDNFPVLAFFFFFLCTLRPSTNTISSEDQFYKYHFRWKLWIGWLQTARPSMSGCVNLINCQLSLCFKRILPFFCFLLKLICFSSVRSSGSNLSRALNLHHSSSDLQANFMCNVRDQSEQSESNQRAIKQL